MLTHPPRYHYSGHTCRRIDEYQGEYYRVFVTGPQDRSPEVSTYWYPGKTKKYTDYDGERCPCCYLGFTHSEDEHWQNVNTWNRRQQQWEEERRKREEEPQP